MPKKTTGLDAVMKEINKVYGPGTLLAASDATSLVLDRISTGVFDLDMRIGGGWPRGRISVIKGEFSTCKTGLCLKGVASAQSCCRFCGTPMYTVDLYGESTEHGCVCGKNKPMRVVWLDAERSFSEDWAKKNGVDTSNILVIQTEYAEQGIDVADRVIRSKECDFLVTDSVAAMTPGIEVEESSEKQQMGVHARLMGKMCRKWTSGLNSYGLLGETKCTILLINQLRLNIGGYGAKMVSPGGKAIDFFSSLELRLKRPDYLMVRGRPVAANIEYVVKKNKTAPPAGEGGMFSIFIVPIAGFPIGAVDNHVQVLRLASYWGLIEKKGSWIQFPDDGPKVQGDAKAAAELRKRPQLLAELTNSVKEYELAWMNEGVPDEEDSEKTDSEKTSP